MGVGEAAGFRRKAPVFPLMDHLVTNSAKPDHHTSIKMKIDNTCPFCGQGSLWRIRLKPIDKISFSCDECDTVWLHYKDVGKSKGVGIEYLFDWMGIYPYDQIAHVDYLEVVPFPKI